MKKKISYGSYIITFIIISLIIWGQTRDEQLLPDIKSNAQLIPETTIAPEQNAFLAMLGFNILDPNKMVSAGYQALQDNLQQVKKNPLEFMQLLELPKSLDKELELYQLPCDINQINKNCLAEITAQKNIIEKYFIEQQGYVNNYLALQKYSQFAHLFARNTNASLPLLYISDISQLLTAKAILDIQAGHVNKGMQFILNDIKFYRNMLNNNQRSLDETNMFISSLLQHYFVIDRLIHSNINPKLKPYITELIPLLTPLSKQQRSLTWALENERNTHLMIQISLAYQNFYTGDNNIAGCQKESCALSRYFLRLVYKFNGILNATYRDWQPTIDFAKKDYPLDDNYLSLLKSLRQIEVNHHSPHTYRLYDRYGLFLLKNYEGEKQKNAMYYADGYTTWFMKIYILNNTIKQLNTAIENSHYL